MHDLTTLPQESTNPRPKNGLAYYCQGVRLANLCADKWLADDYERKSVAQLLIQCLEQNGLQHSDDFFFFFFFFYHKSQVVQSLATPKEVSSNLQVRQECKIKPFNGNGKNGKMLALESRYGTAQF